MEELLQIGLGLFGGLALFLYGMNLMSSNLQEAAGERMRAILAAVTKNPFFGVLAGALATAVLQSSSATIAVLQNFAATPGNEPLAPAVRISDPRFSIFSTTGLS